MEWPITKFTSKIAATEEQCKRSWVFRGSWHMKLFNRSKDNLGSKDEKIILHFRMRGK